MQRSRGMLFHLIRGEILKVTKNDKKILEMLTKGKKVEDISKELNLTKLDVQFSIIRLKREGLFKVSQPQPESIPSEKPETKPAATAKPFKNIDSFTKRDEKKDPILKKYTLDELIETGADKLLHLVDSNKKISIQKIANELKLDYVLIEEWAKILEEHKLIELHYPLFGKPALMVVGYREERKKNKKEKKTETEKERKSAKAIKISDVKKKSSKKGGIAILIIGLLIIFFAALLTDRLPVRIPVLDNFADNIKTFIENITTLATSSELYFELSVIIIIVIVVVVLVALKKSSRLKLWRWKKGSK